MEKFVLVGNPWASLFTLGTEHLEIFKFNPPLHVTGGEGKKREDMDANKITLAGYIAYLQGMYKQYGK